MEQLIEDIKKATIATMQAGATGEEIGKILSERFGFQNARLVMASIALDLGMKAEVEEYLSGI